MGADPSHQKRALRAELRERRRTLTAPERTAATEGFTERLTELTRRAARADVTIIQTHLLGALPKGPFDLVLLDAPCSGSGTWRRQPELKWRLTPDRLAARARAEKNAIFMKMPPKRKDMLHKQNGKITSSWLTGKSCYIPSRGL